MGIKDHYARLATTGEPEDAYALLVKLETWPCHLYAAASVRTRQETLRWLIDHRGAVSRLDEKYGWTEQWYCELLTVAPTHSTEIVGIAKKIEGRRLSTPSRRLYARLRRADRSTAVTLSWLRHLANSSAWSDVIGAASEALPAVEDGKSRLDVYRILIEAHLQRGRVASAHESDGVRALHLLFAVHREGLWDGELGGVLERATDAALPADLKVGRGEPTNPVADIYRGLVRFAKELGRAIGGREASIPLCEGVVKSAPSLLASGRVEQFLESSDRHQEEFRRAVGDSRGEAEAAAIAGGVSVGGFWTLAMIDGDVLRAMTVASSGNPESLWRLREIARSWEGGEGAMARLSGYVAEQRVAVDLVRNGHVVEFPDHATQPGWDLRVDGQPVQVKCSMDADYVMEHFERYPDIPVIANAELAEQLGDHPMVWIDPGLSHAEIVQTTGESVGALADFGDADDLLPIPLVAFAFAMVRNYRDLDRGLIDGKGFAERVGVDVGARAVGGSLGKIVGGVVGSALGPVGAVVGASIGAFVASVAGGTAADAVNRKELCDARDDVVAALGDFATWFRKTLLRPRITVLAERHADLAEWARKASAAGQAPTYVATFYAASAEMVARARKLDEWLLDREGGDDFARAHGGWVALREAGGFFHPELKVRVARVRDALEGYAAEAERGADGVGMPVEA